MHKTQDKPANGAEVLKFFDWALRNGDASATALDYVPMPDSVEPLIRKLWADNVKDAAGKAVFAGR
jgi:phosphate transport system substrate-binding protein